MPLNDHDSEQRKRNVSFAEKVDIIWFKKKNEQQQQQQRHSPEQASPGVVTDSPPPPPSPPPRPPTPYPNAPKEKHGSRAPISNSTKDKQNSTAATIATTSSNCRARLPETQTQCSRPIADAKHKYCEECHKRLWQQSLDERSHQKRRTASSSTGSDYYHDPAQFPLRRRHVMPGTYPDGIPPNWGRKGVDTGLGATLEYFWPLVQVFLYFGGLLFFAVVIT